MDAKPIINFLKRFQSLFFFFSFISLRFFLIGKRQYRSLYNIVNIYTHHAYVCLLDMQTLNSRAQKSLKRQKKKMIVWPGTWFRSPSSLICKIESPEINFYSQSFELKSQSTITRHSFRALHWIIYHIWLACMCVSANTRGTKKNSTNLQTGRASGHRSFPQRNQMLVSRVSSYRITIRSAPL